MGALSTHRQTQSGAQATTGGNSDQAGTAFPLEMAWMGNRPQKGGQSGGCPGVESPEGHVRGHPELGGKEVGTGPAHPWQACQACHQGAASLSGAFQGMGIPGGGTCHRGGQWGKRACKGT